MPAIHEDWFTLPGGLLAILLGVAVFVFGRVFGSAVDYRGILWRKPWGYESDSMFRRTLLTRYPADGFFFGLARVYAYVFEGFSLLCMAAGVLIVLGSVLSLIF